MRLLDYYVQHLVQHNATAVELQSDRPVRFRFPAGDRQSSKPIVHAQIAQLVEETAPPDALGRVLPERLADQHVLLDVPEGF